MTQHVLENAAVLEVIELVEGIDPANQRYPLKRSAAHHDLGNQALARLEFPMQAAERDLLIALEAQGLPRSAFLEYQRHHAHADQVRAVDALERLADHRADAEQHRALGGPVARGA